MRCKLFLLLVIVVLLRGVADAGLSAVVHNTSGATTGEDSITVSFIVTDSIGNLSGLDSVFIAIWNSVGDSVYAAGYITTASEIDSIDLGGNRTVWRWTEQVADIDAGGIGGAFTGIVIGIDTLDGTSADYLDQSGFFSFQLINSEYAAQLDSASFAQIALRPTTIGRTVDVLATGEVGIDLDNVNGTLSDAEIADITVGSVTAEVQADMTKISGVALAADNLEEAFDDDAVGPTFRLRAFNVVAAGTDSAAVNFDGTGSGAAIQADGGATGAGLAATGLIGIRADVSGASPAVQIKTTGSGDAIKAEIASGATGSGAALRLINNGGVTHTGYAFLSQTDAANAAVKFVSTGNHANALAMQIETSGNASVNNLLIAAAGADTTVHGKAMQIEGLLHIHGRDGRDEGGILLTSGELGTALRIQSDSGYAVRISTADSAFSAVRIYNTNTSAPADAQGHAITIRSLTTTGDDLDMTFNLDDLTGDFEGADFADTYWDSTANRTDSAGTSNGITLDSLAIFLGLDASAKSIAKKYGDLDTLFYLNGVDTLRYRIYYHTGGAAGDPPDSTKTFNGAP